ncbi:MAG: riboflavin synthase [Casimicrobiaceae bacterium]
MFTGIIRARGRTVARRPSGDGVRLAVATEASDFADVHIGDSVAVNGCCLTVVTVAGSVLEFEVSAETLACTTGFPIDAAVNLEPALRLADRLDGHLVSGHVDGIGIVAAFHPVAAMAAGASVTLAIDAPSSLGRFIAAKGSIAVDGVSLTTNTVTDAADGRVRCTANVIPHTLAVTTLGTLRAGATVNLEVDLLARYLDRLRRAHRSESEPGGTKHGPDHP